MISQEHKETFSKGDRVFVTSVEREGRLSPKARSIRQSISARGLGTVRGPGTKQFRGLLRVLYADGSQYHVKWDAEFVPDMDKVRRLGHGNHCNLRPEELQKLPADPPKMPSCGSSHGRFSEPLSPLSPLSPLLFVTEILDDSSLHH